MFLTKKLPTQIFVIVIIAVGVISLVSWRGILVFEDIRQISNDITKLSQDIHKAEKAMTGWKTYRNYEYGFEVKYPGNWKIEDLTGSLKKENDQEHLSDVRFSDESGKMIAIHVYNSRGLSLNQWLDWYTTDYSGCTIKDRKPISIAGTEGIKGNHACGDVVSEGNFLLKEGKIYNIDLLVFVTELPVENYQEVYTQILSTFKFIEGKVTENGYKTDYIYKTGASGVVESQQLVFVLPEGKKILIPDDVAILIDGPTRFEKTKDSEGQDITSFDMPLNPQNKDVIFLSTSELLNKNYSRITNRIYSYNLKTSELKEIYYEVAEKNSPIDNSRARIFRTVGIDGSKIIVLYDDPENSGGPCTRIWYHDKDQMGYLDLADLQSGLKSYIVPTYKVEEDRIEANKCLEEL